MAASGNLSQGLSDVSPALAREQIVGAPWPSSTWQPSVTLNITYPVSGLEVQLGNIISGFDSKEEPELSFPAESGQLYTLLCVDPDAPSREAPEYGNLNHWLVTGLRKGPDGSQIVKGDAYVTYAGPSQKKSGHRYIFLLYKNPAGKPLKPVADQKTIKGSELMDRVHWDFPAFVEENGLELVAAK
ncbi:hypothetical protein HKX48_002966 [Thoreauomyces humboldtii]|nr:hypothetical protein HKX48_002966 [Thoreauomyces humboldtii]